MPCQHASMMDQLLGLLPHHTRMGGCHSHMEASETDLMVCRQALWMLAVRRKAALCAEGVTSVVSQVLS